MSQSMTFRLRICAASRHLLLTSLAILGLLSSSHLPADDSLLDGNMGFTSSASGNQLIDSASTDDETIPPKLSPAQAAALVRTKVGGQVMSVNSLRNESGIIYGVKVLNDGRMRIINVDGQTGQLLNY
ncbi:PepSY domain-containing protein [Cellvibrio fontiphilus]|uniref:PepSY domain-containing protein n=1 Tax=Cellvibrio fontiphilus TaxID=1815559 RepID=A0ABV7FHI8_9GAMM